MVIGDRRIRARMICKLPLTNYPITNQKTPGTNSSTTSFETAWQLPQTNRVSSGLVLNTATCRLSQEAHPVVASPEAGSGVSTQMSSLCPVLTVFNSNVLRHSAHTWL